MRISRSKLQPQHAKADLLVVGVFEGFEKTPLLAALDAILGGHVKEHARAEDFKAKTGASLVIHTHGKLPQRKLMVLGLGDRKTCASGDLRAAAARAVRAAETQRAKSLALWLPFDKAGQPAEGAKAAAEGATLAAYRYTDYKEDKRPEIEDVTVLGPSALGDKAFAAALESGSLAASASLFARDLVNTPSLDMTPAHLAKEAKKLAAASKRLSIKTYGRAELKKMGCGGILAVAQGSEHEPVFVHLAYKPAGKAKRKIVLAGKGVTFDSGGLSIKPADAMMDMKIDMAGAAAVFGAFSVLPKLNLPVEVHGLAALVENMPSGTAIRPGDIVKTMSGKTIEILNTDAEGRVTLADVLHYGTTLKPDMMIDLATLTGACIAALGQDLAGLMTDDDKLAKRLEEAADASAEPIWRLPLFPDYAELVKSRHADLKNITGGKVGAGTITAGLFLKEFAGSVPWAHLDIAGPAYNEKDYDDERSWGASGYGARLLLEFLRRL